VKKRLRPVLGASRTDNRDGNPLSIWACLGALAVLVVLSALASCGYKAPPSPLFDAGDRFGDEVERVRARDAERVLKERESPAVLFPKRGSSASEQGHAVPTRDGGKAP
jgi:hypothetical protein